MEKTMEKKIAPKPLALSSPSVSTGDEAASVTQRCSSLRKRRRCLLCCLLSFAVSLVVVGVVVLILSLTLFKVKDPTLSMNSLSISRIDVDFGDGGGDGRSRNVPLSINATLDADISIENPNMASFRFGNSTTDCYYGRETVGVAYAPAGGVAAHRTARLFVRVDVLVDRVATQLNLTVDLLTGNEVQLTSYTDIRGRVSVLGLYKRDIELMLYCTIAMEVSIAVQEITSTDCEAIVK